MINKICKPTNDGGRDFASTLTNDFTIQMLRFCPMSLLASFSESCPPQVKVLVHTMKNKRAPNRHKQQHTPAAHHLTHWGEWDLSWHYGSPFSWIIFGNFYNKPSNPISNPTTLCPCLEEPDKSHVGGVQQGTFLKSYHIGNWLKQQIRDIHYTPTPTRSKPDWCCFRNADRVITFMKYIYIKIKQQ